MKYGKLSFAICIFPMIGSSCSEKDRSPEIATIVASHYREKSFKQLTEGSMKKIYLSDLILEMDVNEATLVKKYLNSIITPNKQYSDSFPDKAVFVIIGSGKTNFIIQETGIVVSQPKVTADHLTRD